MLVCAFGDLRHLFPELVDEKAESVAWATDRGGGRWGVGWVGGGGANFVERAAKELSGGEVSR